MERALARYFRFVSSFIISNLYLFADRLFRSACLSATQHIGRKKISDQSDLSVYVFSSVPVIDTLYHDPQCALVGAEFFYGDRKGKSFPISHHRNVLFDPHLFCTPGATAQRCDPGSNDLRNCLHFVHRCH